METHNPMTQFLQPQSKPLPKIKEVATPIGPFEFSSFQVIYSIEQLIICVMALILIFKAYFFRPIYRLGRLICIKRTRNTSLIEITAKILIQKLDKNHKYFFEKLRINFKCNHKLFDWLNLLTLKI